nr:sulfotransferase [Acaryochloris sp. IP29b_bin.148]
MRHNLHSDRVDLSETGKYWLDFISHNYKQGDQFRRQEPSTSICDVNYQDLIQAPIETVHSIYKFFGERLDQVTEQRMKHWLKVNPQNKHGTHRYSLAQFGLTKADVQQSLA